MGGPCAPSTPPHAWILPGEVCRTADGHAPPDAMALGVRTWGDRPDGRDVVLVGTYLLDGAVGRRLLDALPPLLVLPAREAPCCRCWPRRSSGTSQGRRRCWTGCWTCC